MNKEYIEVLKNKISQYEYILKVQKEELQKIRIKLKGLRKELTSAEQCNASEKNM